MKPLSSLSDHAWAYVLLRLSFGLNLLLHGLTRFPHLTEFAEKLTGMFASTWLLPAFVWAFASILPPLEAAIGSLLVIGWQTRVALIAGQLVMCALVFGAALRQEWGTLGVQVVYTLVYYMLLIHRTHNQLSIDAWRRA